MKKSIFILLFAVGLLFVSCGSSSKDKAKEDVQKQKSDIIVFAAASMEETLNMIKEKYELENPDINIVYNFDSSGTLKTQIDEGAECDIFISAAQKQMDAIDADKNSKSVPEFPIDSKTRINLLENKVVLAVPKNNPAGVTGFEDLNTDKVKKIALGNSDVPVGQYSEEILKNMGIWDKLQSKISFGTNVKEVTAWVAENAADCGIVYSTDAFSAGLEAVSAPPEGSLKTPVIYPAAILAGSKHKDNASQFLKYLQSEEAAGIFKSVGFEPVK